MSRKPPNRPGITFEIGARLEALDYLQKWYGRHCVVFAESIIILGSLCALITDCKNQCTY